jgi:hypothetical protein
MARGDKAKPPVGYCPGCGDRCCVSHSDCQQSEPFGVGYWAPSMLDPYGWMPCHSCYGQGCPSCLGEGYLEVLPQADIDALQRRDLMRRAA